MPIAYINKNKGKAIAIFGGILLLSYQIVIQVLLALSVDNEFLTFLFQNTKIQFLDGKYSFTDIFLLFLIIYAFKVIDGFIDGIIMTLIDIEFLIIFRTVFLRDSTLIIELDLYPALVSLVLDMNIIFNILIFGYTWVFIWEFVLLNVKIQLFARIKQFFLIFYYKKIKKIPEIELQEMNKKMDNERAYNRESRTVKDISNSEKKWLDNTQENLILNPDEAYLIEEWTPMKSEFRKSWFEFYILETIAILFYGAVYALIIYNTSDFAGPLYNQTVNAFFFPIWAIVLFAFKNPGTYLRAVIFLEITLFIQNYLWSLGLIDSGGYFISSFIIGVVRVVGLDLTEFYNNIPLEEFRALINSIIFIIMLVEFIILVVNLSIKALKGKSKMEFKVTSEAIYVRKRASFNSYELIRYAMMVIFFPFNVSTYITMFKMIKYKQKSIEESFTYNYGKLTFEKSILQIKKGKVIDFESLPGIIILLVLGIFFAVDLIGIPLLLLAVYKLYMLFNPKNVISVNYLKHKSKGSLFILSTETRLKIFEVPDECLPYFPELRTFR